MIHGMENSMKSIFKDTTIFLPYFIVNSIVIVMYYIFFIFAYIYKILSIPVFIEVFMEVASDNYHKCS